jgi:glutathione S-transferase
VICEYLEDRHPEPALRPVGAADRARARWLEEFADTRLGDVFIWRLFHPLVTRPAVFGEPRDRELVERTLANDVPQVLDYLEGELPAEGFLFGSLGIADVSIAAFFRNAAFARFSVDAARWPRTAAFVLRVLATPAFERLRPCEEKLLRTPVAGHRAALAELGVPLTAESFAVATPRRGVMPT